MLRWVTGCALQCLRHAIDPHPRGCLQVTWDNRWELHSATDIVVSIDDIQLKLVQQVMASRRSSMLVGSGT
jgi:hypothetical protein